MSARNKKERKQQQRRKRQRRELNHQAKRRTRAVGELVVAESGAGETELPTNHFDEADGPHPRAGNLPRGVAELFSSLDNVESAPPAQSTKEQSEAELWWGTYSKADGTSRLQMARHKLETVSTADETYEDFFPEAIDELASQLSPGDYVAFLEELLENHADVFSSSADWNTQSMVFEYLAQGRLEDVDRVVMDLASGLKEVG